MKSVSERQLDRIEAKTKQNKSQNKNSLSTLSLSYFSRPRLSPPKSTACAQYYKTFFCGTILDIGQY
jgi:hypothetical protein